jgi:cysteinyl-tRNA synthetase, unknown class
MGRILKQQGRLLWLLVVVFVLIGNFISCKPDDNPAETIYRQQMRNFVIRLSEYAKLRHPGFLIIPQNGQELITLNGESNGIIQLKYIQSIDGSGREDLFYGYVADNMATPDAEKNQMLSLCTRCQESGVVVLVTDYCATPSKIDSSYSWNFQNKFISFAAPERNLNIIPDYPVKPYNENGSSMESIHTVRNFLYLINSENYETKEDFINAVSATWYDLIIIDLFHFEEAFTSQEIARLKIKPNGNNRYVVSYLSIGEAEDYRYYWNKDWKTNKPEWLEAENPEWEGNYKVQYWDTAWQQIIFGRQDSYLDKILNAGFDGAYLDLVDAFEYFEE